MSGESTGEVTCNPVAKGTSGKTVSAEKGKKIPQRAEANPEPPAPPTFEPPQTPALWRSRLKGQSTSEEINTDISESVFSMSISQSVDTDLTVSVDTNFELPGYTVIASSPDMCPPLPLHEYTMLETPPSMFHLYDPAEQIMTDEQAAAYYCPQ